MSQVKRKRRIKNKKHLKQVRREAHNKDRTVKQLHIDDENRLGIWGIIK